MIGGQKQEAAENALAIQVGSGDVIVHRELTITQMASLVREMRNVVIELTADALLTAQERIENLEHKMAEKFIHSEQADSAAFKDPDFQVLYRQAQQNCARSDNENTTEIMVELLAKRSKIQKRDRIALIINEATEKVNKLTDEDLAILSLCFVTQNISGGATNYDDLVRHYMNFVSPFVKEIRENSSGCAYLESIGCATINRLTQNTLPEMIYAGYDLIFSDYFDYSEIEILVPSEDDRNKLFAFLVARDKQMFTPFAGTRSMVPKPTGQSNSQLEWRFSVPSTAALSDSLGRNGFDTALVNDIVKFAKDRCRSQEEAIAQLFCDIPVLSELNDKWLKTDLPRCNLTSVGIVIAHASLSNVHKRFNAPLSMWIN